MNNTNNIPLPAIGTYQAVTCVRLRKKQHDSLMARIPVGTWIPVYGPMHEDAEIIGFKPEHWHVDWRFVSPRLWGRLLVGLADGDQLPEFLHGVVLREESALAGFPRPDVRVRRLRVKRQMPGHRAVTTYRDAWSGKRLKIGWQKALEAKYAQAVAKCGVCPHKGLPLIARGPKGQLVCTGHGLCFSKRTGKLLPQFRDSERPCSGTERGREN